MIAEAGAQLGTEHPTAPEFQTFGYRRQATALAHFEPETPTAVRLYLPGQNRSRRAPAAA